MPNSTIPTTISLLKNLEPKGVTLEDILRLHQFGFLSALPFPKFTIAGLQRELDSAFPEDTPTQQQVIIYQLAIALIRNDPKQLSTFIAPRLHHYWCGADSSDSTTRWHFQLQAETPCKYLPEYSCLHNHGIETQPRPRLIDRFHVMTDQDIIIYLEQTKEILTRPMYDTFYRRHFCGETVSNIAKSRTCSKNAVYASYHTALTKLRWLSPSLRELVFGPDTIGAIRESAD